MLNEPIDPKAGCCRNHWDGFFRSIRYDANVILSGLGPLLEPCGISWYEVTPDHMFTSACRNASPVAATTEAIPVYQFHQ